MRSLLLSMTLLSLGIAGCTPDLGICDQDEASTIVYFRDPANDANPSNGIPLYAGQALMQQSCGDGGFCHSPNASGSSRFGAPEGLDFHVGLACTTGSCEDEDVARLIENQTRVYEHRHDIFGAVDDGSMPPGETGAEIVAGAGEYVVFDPNELVACGALCSVLDPPNDPHDVLPNLETKEGRDVLRNWLSCGSPVIEATEDPFAVPPGLRCGTAVGEAGECIVRVAATITPPEPTWTSVYDEIIGPLCGVSCHGPGIPDLRAETMLDLSTSLTAYGDLVGEAALGSSCIGEGDRVVAGDSATSLLIEKLQPDPRCGDVMPPTSVPLPADVVAAIAQWIDDGALLN